MNEHREPPSMDGGLSCNTQRSLLQMRLRSTVVPREGGPRHITRAGSPRSALPWLLAPSLRSSRPTKKPGAPTPGQFNQRVITSPISSPSRQRMDPQMTVLHESPVAPSQSTPSRQVAVMVGGAVVVVPCPLWCTHPHNEEYRTLSDVSHHSASFSLAAPTYGGVEQTLTARISSWPFAGDPETAVPFIAFDAVGDEVAQLAPAAALAVADQVIAHGHALRTLAASIAD